MSAEEIHEERDAQMRAQYIDPVENFPHLIDRLLDAVNRVCFYSSFLSILSFAQFSST